MLRDSRDIIRRLQQEGFELVSVKGSHHQVSPPRDEANDDRHAPKAGFGAWDRQSHLQAGRMGEGLGAMPHYIALIHKDADSCYGVSFPDIPGVTTAGDTIDEAMKQAIEVLEFAAEDWSNSDGTTGFKPPRSIDQLRMDPEFLEDARDAVVAAIPFRTQAQAAE